MTLSFNRNADILKKIIFKHVLKGNIIVYYSWSGYNWISQPQSGYIHSIHNHGHGDFCHGSDSTSIIMGVLGNLKQILKSIYYSIPHINFILFIREAELSRNIKDYTSEEKFVEILDIIKYINDLVILNLYKDEEFLAI